METNIVICLLVGLPGSGKTSLANSLVNDSTTSHKLGIKVVKFSFDDFFSLEQQEVLVRKTVNSPDQKLFKDARESFVLNVFNLISDIKSGKENYYEKEQLEIPKYLVILDDNFYYKSMRYRYYQMAAKLNSGFCQIYLHCDVNVVKERNRQREGYVSDEVIDIMKTRIEPPSNSNSWEKESLLLDSSIRIREFNEIWKLVERNFSNGLSVDEHDEVERRAAQERNMKNLLHRSDLILRVEVGNKLKLLNTEKKASKHVCASVNQARKVILLQLKNNCLLAPSLVFDSNNEIKEEELRKFLKEEFDTYCKINT